MMISPKQIKALEKRAAHLRKRVEEQGPDQSSFDVTEHAALMTAIADLKYYQSFEPALSQALAQIANITTHSDKVIVSEILAAWRLTP